VAASADSQRRPTLSTLGARDQLPERYLAGNTYMSDPEALSAAAAWASRLLGAPGAEPVKRALMVAVSELHIKAGWAGFNAGLHDRAMDHYGCALKLATEAGDACYQAVALTEAGLTTVEHGHPDDGLKLLQVGAVTALDIPLDEQRAVVVGENGRSAV